MSFVGIVRKFVFLYALIFVYALIAGNNMKAKTLNMRTELIELVTKVMCCSEYGCKIKEKKECSREW